MASDSDREYVRQMFMICWKQTDGTATFAWETLLRLRVGSPGNLFSGSFTGQTVSTWQQHHRRLHFAFRSLGLIAPAAAIALGCWQDGPVGSGVIRFIGFLCDAFCIRVTNGRQGRHLRFGS